MNLDEVSSFKYLGIVINNRLTWQDHVDQMSSKINKKLGLLKVAERSFQVPMSNSP